jgi:hypothetical protein
MRLQTVRGPAFVLLAIELLDELVFGAREAAWPAIREELDLSYAEIGLLLSVPMYSSAVLEPRYCGASTASLTPRERPRGGLYAGFLVVPGVVRSWCCSAPSGSRPRVGTGPPVRRAQRPERCCNGARKLQRPRRRDVPLAIGLVAQRYGLDVALWMLVAGPLALLALVPRS